MNISFYSKRQTNLVINRQSLKFKKSPKKKRLKIFQKIKPKKKIKIPKMLLLKNKIIEIKLQKKIKIKKNLKEIKNKNRLFKKYQRDNLRKLSLDHKKLNKTFFKKKIYFNNESDNIKNQKGRKLFQNKNTPGPGKYYSLKKNLIKEKLLLHKFHLKKNIKENQEKKNEKKLKNIINNLGKKNIIIKKRIELKNLFLKKNKTKFEFFLSSSKRFKNENKSLKNRRNNFSLDFPKKKNNKEFSIRNIKKKINYFMFIKK